MVSLNKLVSFGGFLMGLKMHSRKPDIENVYKVLKHEKPSRPTLFEFILNFPLIEKLAGRKMPKTEDWDFEYCKLVIDAFAAAGYDFACINGSSFGFPSNRHQEDGKNTLSLNEGVSITDWASFENYKWPEPENFDYSRLDKLGEYIPDGMKLMICGPCGVLENVIQLTGYDNLCILLYEEPELAKAVFDNVGKRLVKYYEIAAPYESVGLIMSNDDWGFKTQTLLSHEQLREHVFPWHKKIAETAHANKKPVILHSCGHFAGIIDDIVDGIGFDGRHSYEDIIIPVEKAYDKWHKRIAILGGMDVDFLINNDEKAITARARKMLDRADADGSYALGTGNSVPEYIPQDHYFAMIKAALEY
jgi:uroporphyrinogen decarboxylase